jgi:hypothetical protein
MQALNINFENRIRRKVKTQDVGSGINLGYVIVLSKGDRYLNSISTY